MTSKKRRRASRKGKANRATPAMHHLAAAVRCPDCDSETGSLWLDEHGIWHLPVAHDSSCPWLAQREKWAAS